MEAALNGRILYVDDDTDALAVVEAFLSRRGYVVTTESDAEKAVERALESELDVVVTDLCMAKLDGLAVCEQLVAAKPSLPVVVLTGKATLDVAIAAMRAGAYDFVQKPIHPEILFGSIQRATQTSRLREEVRRLREPQPSDLRTRSLGESPPMRRIASIISHIAPTDATVCITGESGTGKELIARAIHENSRRADGPFVAINCAAMPAQLLESELFGHVRGAFTDAKSTRSGLFLEAQGGTLFLDEIGEMPVEMQAKLLRALQERTVRAVGGSHEVPFDARLVTATARDLEEEVAAKRFRADLFYRINVCAIEVPPLREREGDIALLAQRFTSDLAKHHGKDVRGLTSATLAKLISYEWPGNVRELENCIERAVTMTQTTLLVPKDLPASVQAFKPSLVRSIMPETLSGVVTMEELERLYTAHVLHLTGGNKARTARLLGYDRRTIYRKLDPMRRPPRAPDDPLETLSPVVVVDGDTRGRDDLATVLTSEGFVVHPVGSVAEARSVKRAAVIVFAGSAADGDARELVRIGGPAVVWLSDHTDVEDSTRFAEILPKPARAEEVCRAVRSLIIARGLPS
jgi:two-component system response regulator HydG